MKDSQVNNDYALVSIIINNYNYGRFLETAIRSALDQDYPNIEVIVVDDGSTDNSRDIIGKYSGRIVPVLKENGGQVSSFNAGFEASQGNIICFLDSDDFFQNSKVSTIINLFNSYPDADWVFHRLQLIRNDSGDLLRYSQESSCGECDFRAQMRTTGKLSFFPPPTSGLCFLRRLLQAIFPMPESFLKTNADIYLRLAGLAQAKGYYTDQVLSSQLVHDNNSMTGIHGLNLNEDTIVVAHFLRSNLPELSKFSNNLFVRGFSAFLKKKSKSNEYKQYIETYLKESSKLEVINIFLMTIARIFLSSLSFRISRANRAVSQDVVTNM